MENPLCEVIIEGNKIQLSEEPLPSPLYKGFIQGDVDIAITVE